jgi:orotate phosphoribosyltransferase
VFVFEQWRTLAARSAARARRCPKRNRKLQTPAAGGNETATPAVAIVILSVTKQSEAVLELFHRTGAYLRGHFLLTSGLHSPEYLQCAKVLQYPKYSDVLGQAIAESFGQLEGRRIDVVAAPAMGGLIIGHEVARSLGARFIFTERDASGRMTLRRGFSVQPKEAAVVVEDVITTGGSSREVIELLRAEGTDVKAAGSIVDRSGGRADIGVRRMALLTLNVVVYAPEICPMCHQGFPLVKPGSRKAPPAG